MDGVPGIRLESDRDHRLERPTHRLGVDVGVEALDHTKFKQ
jgi:hypothetical protein